MILHVLTVSIKQYIWYNWKYGNSEICAIVIQNNPNTTLVVNNEKIVLDVIS